MMLAQICATLMLSACNGPSRLAEATASEDQEVYGYAGLPISADVPSFMPFHITGPNEGKKACPLCVYGNQVQIQIWVQESAIDAGLKWLRSWDAFCSSPTGADAQPYLIVVPSKATGLSSSTKAILTHSKFKRAFITTVPSWTDPETSAIYGHSDRSRPNVRTYIAVNRRLLWRVDDPKVDQTMALETKAKEGLKFVLRHELSDAQIAPLWEPGQRMIVEFEVVDAKGRPVSGVKIGAHQADSGGRYNKPPWNRRTPRLETTAWTDKQGRIKFTTIRPGPYPSKTEPAHIHFGIEWQGRPRFRTLWFEGDPLLSKERRDWAAKDEETVIEPVRVENGVIHVRHRFVVKD